MRRVLVIAGLVLAVVLAGGGLALAAEPALVAGGPTQITGTAATETFTIGDRTVRQFRYADHGTLVYTFRLHNAGWLPVTVTGMEPPADAPRLLHYRSLTDTAGHRRFVVPAHGTAAVRLSFRMSGCEHLSARAGSFATAVGVLTERARLVDGTTQVTLPEQLHTGSPREAFCPNSTATSRPPG